MNIREKGSGYTPQPELDDDVEDIVVHQRYGVEYQPIISIKSGDIIAYEALARFYQSNGEQLTPRSVFASLHTNLPLLNQVEFELKQLQFDFAPANYNLFVNLDPHAVKSIVDLENDSIIQFLCQKQHAIVEFIENIDIHDARACTSLHETLSAHNIRTALDDVGAVNSLISLELLILVDYIKFDRSWFSMLDNEIYQKLLRSLTDFSRSNNQPMVLEGIEDTDMLEVARSFGIDYAQGFLYRDLFKSQNP